MASNAAEESVLIVTSLDVVDYAVFSDRCNGERVVGGGRRGMDYCCNPGWIFEADLPTGDVEIGNGLWGCGELGAKADNLLLAGGVIDTQNSNGD